MSMGDDLMAIIKEAREIQEQDAQKPLIDCPVCGTRLDKNSRGAVNCPLGHFYAPTDARPR